MVDIQHLMHKPPPAQAHYRRQRMTGDMYRRALPGTIFYAIAYLLAASAGGYIGRFGPGWLVTVLAAYAVLWGLRWVHRPPQDLSDNPAVHRWWHRHWALVYSGCGLWGGIFLLVGMVEQAPSMAFLIATVSTIAFASAACETYALNRWHALGLVIVLQIPALIYFLVTLPALRPISVVVVFNFIYQLAHIRRRAAEYDAQMQLEHALITSRYEVERLSQQDALTGLANRREYESNFNAHWHAAARLKAALALMVIDLDHFKRVNDAYGHAAGDACLQHVAARMQDRFRRASDLVARTGGEEFAVVLPDTTVEEAILMAQALRDDLAANPLIWEGVPIEVTASIGVDSVRWDVDDSPQASYRRIDQACYQAKGSGRNQVVHAATRTDPAAGPRQAFTDNTPHAEI